MISLDLSPSEMDYEAWSVGQCVYKCAICDKVFQHSLDFYRHVDRDYGLDPQRYKERHGVALLRKITIECQVPGCLAKVSHDFGKVGAHLASIHPAITMREYYDEHVAKTKNIKKEAVGSYEDMAEARPNANPASLPSMKRPLKVRSNPTRSSKRRKTPELKVEVERQSDWCNRSLLSCDKTASEYEQINTIYKSTNNTATLWYEQCIMKCKRCQKTFNNYDIAREHEKKQKHGLCVFFRKVKYQCKICQSNVLCRKDAIDHHLTDKHGISLDDYGNSFENQQTTLAASTSITDSPNPNINSTTNKKSDIGKKNDGSESPLRRRDAIDHHLTDKHGLSLEEYGKHYENEMTLWYEECIMKCKRCQKTFNNSDTARQHEKKQKHGLCVFSRKIQYQCKICQSNVLCHRDAIDHHLTDKHGISLEDYGNSYENQQTTLAASTTITDSQNPNIKRPDKKKSDTGMKNKNDESSLCRRDAIDHQLTDKHGLSLEEYGKRYEKTLWYEQCIMKCKRCRKTYNNSDTARQHEKKQKHGLCVFFRKVQYQCKICQSNVLCCKNAINHHLTDTHGISLYDYGNNYENKLTTFSASTSITNSPSPNIKSLYKKKSDTGMQNNNDENPLCRIEGEKGKVDSEDILPTQGAQCPLSNSCLRIYNLVEYSFHLFSVHRMVDNDVSRNFLDEMKGCLRL